MFDLPNHDINNLINQINNVIPKLSHDSKQLVIDIKEELENIKKKTALNINGMIEKIMPYVVLGIIVIIVLYFANLLLLRPVMMEGMRHLPQNVSVLGA